LASLRLSGTTATWGRDPVRAASVSEREAVPARSRSRPRNTRRSGFPEKCRPLPGRGGRVMLRLYSNTPYSPEPEFAPLEHVPGAADTLFLRILPLTLPVAPGCPLLNPLPLPRCPTGARACERPRLTQRSGEK